MSHPRHNSENPMHHFGCPLTCLPSHGTNVFFTISHMHESGQLKGWTWSLGWNSRGEHTCGGVCHVKGVSRNVDVRFKDRTELGKRRMRVARESGFLKSLRQLSPRVTTARWILGNPQPLFLLPFLSAFSSSFSVFSVFSSRTQPCVFLCHLIACFTCLFIIILNPICI